MKKVWQTLVHNNACLYKIYSSDILEVVCDLNHAKLCSSKTIKRT